MKTETLFKVFKYYGSTLLGALLLCAFGSLSTSSNHIFWITNLTWILFLFGIGLTALGIWELKWTFTEENWLPASLSTVVLAGGIATIIFGAMITYNSNAIAYTLNTAIPRILPTIETLLVHAFTSH